MDGESDYVQPISLPSADAAKRAGFGEQLLAAAAAHRTKLLRLLRQVPGFLDAVQKVTSHGGLYRVLVSNENANLLREGADGIVKPFLRRGGRFVENVDLVRMPPDIAGAVAILAIQAVLTEISVKLDQIKNGVDNLTLLVAQANQGGLKGATTALEAAHQLSDAGERRIQMLTASGQVVLQLGTVIGQMGAHIQQMPAAETGFFDGWDGDWEEQAAKAHGRVRGDFAVIAEGMRCVLGAYWDLAEFKAAYVAFERISGQLDAAGLAKAVERARLLPYVKVSVAPEQIFAQFIAARPRIEETLRRMTEELPSSTGVGVQLRGDRAMIGEFMGSEGPACGCGRPLITGESCCPHCSRQAAAWWKVPTKYAAASVVTLVVTTVLFVVTKGAVKPRV